MFTRFHVGVPRAGLLTLLLCLLSASGAVGAQAPSRLAYEPVAGASPVALPERPIDAAEMQSFFDGLLAGQFAAHKLAGASVIVVKDGKVLFEKGYGYADVDKRVAVDPARTRFTTGSISKLFVWTAVMQLVEEGRLDLDVDINRYLSKFKIHDQYQNPVTLRALLTHSAGFEDVGTPFAPQIAGRYASLADFLAAHLPKRVMAPVTDYSHASRPYSNWGALLAASVVENVSGERFDRYAERHIFQPLGMANSRFQTAAQQGGASRALGYRFNNGAMVPSMEDMTPSGPAGALIATPDDIARFMIAHLQDGAFDGKRILTEPTAQLMQRRGAQSNPHLNGMALGFIEAHLNGRRALRHDGSTRFNHSNLVLFADQKLGLFVTYNSEEGGYASPEAVKAFVDRYLPGYLPRVSPPLDFSRRAPDYTGSYRSLRRSFTTYEKILGSFPIKVSALPNRKLLAAGSQWTEVAPDTFRNDSGDMLGFNRDSSGRVRSLNLGYSIVPAEKVAWYEDASLHALLAVLCLGCAAGAVAWGIRWRGWRATHGGFRWAGWLLAATGALNLISFLLIALVLSRGIPGLMSTGVPGALIAGLCLAMLSAPLTLGCLVMAAAMLRFGVRSWPARLAYAGLASASALYLALLDYWNLLGIHLG